MRRLIHITLLSLLVSHMAFAEVTARGLAPDSRIQMVPYEANEVVQIMGHDLVHTTIQFSESESILEVALGDPSAWQVKRFEARPHLLSLKPQVAFTDGNMTVITSKRLYDFRLTADDAKLSPENVAYRVVFQYDDDAGLSLNSGIKAWPVASSGDSHPADYQWDYYFTGHRELKPIAVFDNRSNKTYFRFKSNQALPAIFAVTEDNEESLVNFHVRGDFVVVESLSTQFILRLGDRFVKITQGQPK